ncbi:MAG: acyl-CoA dehydrogenase C-terminal domain-containing protein [Proteobacteria bacterium]|nr:acyl-CoA dehydrogenase C-terminal domain-containing protein [Pseudomonadota bacterium]
MGRFFAGCRFDRECKAIVLRGAGDHFCVGLDLVDAGDTETLMDDLVRGDWDMTHTLRAMRAWLWLWQALTATAALAEGSSETAFYSGKLAACRYFFRHELPLVEARFALVGSLDRTCLDARPDWFTGA